MQGNVTGSVDTVTSTVGAVAAAVTVGTINAGVITAASIAADALTAAKVATDLGQRMTAGSSPLWRGYRLTPDEAFHRDVMFSLKNDPYIDCALFRSAYNRTPVERFARIFEQLESLGLVTVDNDRIGLTAKGRLCVEEITCLFRHPAIHSTDSPVSGMELLQKHNFAPSYPAVAW